MPLVPQAHVAQGNPVDVVIARVKQFRQFTGEVWSELKKTTWPGKREVYGTTLVVIVTVLICALYLWVVDLVLSSAMERLLGALGS